MPSNKPLVPLLRARDQELRRIPLSLAADHRVRRLLRDGEPRPFGSRRLLWAPLLIAVGALVTFFLQGQREQVPIAGPAVPQTGHLAPAPSCTVKEIEGTGYFSGRCTLELGTATVRTDTETEVRRASPSHFEVVFGKAWFDVARVPAGADPVRVHVGGGVIEVLGTRFVVEQGSTEGSVHLLEGRIRFCSKNGADFTEIHPGERFRWLNAASSTVTAREPALALSPNTSREVAPAPDVSRPSTRPSRAPTADREREAAADLAAQASNAAGKLANEAVERVMALRTQGRYRQALALLAELHGTKFDARTAEVLSFEEGNLLEHLDDASATCRHWRLHVHRFPAGPYREFVDTKILGLACP